MADKSLIGTEMGTVTFPVERGKIREIATTVLVDHPVYKEERPPAPLTFSMTTGWPSAPRIRSAMTRASVSVGPPAGNGTTIVTGRDG